MLIDPLSVGTAAGGWLLGQYGKEWTDKLLGAAKEQWRDFNWGKAAKQYRESLRMQNATIRILGKSDPVPLEDIFTDVYTLDEITGRRRYDIEELRKLGEDRFELARQAQKRREGLNLIKQGRNLFILGKPGAGKTTFLRYITLQAANGLIDKIPIFLSLNAWSMQVEEAIMAFIVKQFDMCNFPDAQPFIEHLLENGKAIVLFDGLDEVKLEGDLRRNLTFVLNNFAQKYTKTQMLITCRIAASGYQFTGFYDVEIADFTRDQIHAYARKWFGTDIVKYSAFIADLYEERNEGLRELCANPLLLSMLCLAFDRTMSFPQRRAALYEDATEALLEQWDASREIKRNEMYHYEMYRHMDRQQKVRLLAALAAEAFEGGHYFLERKWLEQRIATFMKRLPGIPPEDDIDGGVVLRAIEIQHSLLVERANHVYAYSHLSFQEYFTAKYIVVNEARGTVKKLIRSHLTDNRWREVFLLTANMLDNAEDFFMEMRQAIDMVVADNENITTLLAWAMQKATQNRSTAKLGLRSLFIYFVLLYNFTRAVNRTESLEGARVHTRAFNLAINLARAHALNRNDALELDDNVDHAIEIAHDLNLAINFALDDNIIPGRALRDRDLAHALRELIRSRAISSQTIRSRDLASELARIIGIDMDKTVGSANLEYNNLIFSYLYATQLLDDCLQVATVSNRNEIKESLLLPPKQDNSKYW